MTISSTQATFKNTSIWKRTLEVRQDDIYETQRTQLRAAFLKMREKATALVERISSEMPGYTVHDITHLDALWEMADLVIGPEYDLNPAEAFVLGGAILLHDAAMTVHAYPGGLSEIEKQVEWMDEYAKIEKSLGEGEGAPDGTSIEKVVLPNVLRRLHARQAETLATQGWTYNDRTDYLIDDAEIREFYGEVIGRIAGSHHWNVEDIADKLRDTLGAARTLPTEWSINPIKLAGILRCADACHVDARRAPRYQHIIERPKGVSESHWNFQERMSKPLVNDRRLKYTSSSGFGINEIDAWWVCYDTLVMINRELTNVDRLFERLNIEQSCVGGVLGADSPEDMSRYVPTVGWEPIKAELRISDVKQIVELFGGSKLYGKNPYVPIRELIQNSLDAIKARELIDKDFSKTSGKITLKLSKVGENHLLEVADNGCGMSRNVMTGSLLDFGKSFWASESLMYEFPGLLAKGMSSIGKFGIGFYSVFMLGEHVQVNSKRFDQALSDFLTLEFRNGVKGRPILLRADASDYRSDMNTVVKVKLAEGRLDASGKMSQSEEDLKVWCAEFKNAIYRLCPNIDTELDVEIDLPGCTMECSIQPTDFLGLSNEEFVERFAIHNYGQIDPAAVTLLQGEDGELFGRATLSMGRYDSNRDGIVTVGGLAAGYVEHFAGVLYGETDVISRNEATPRVPQECLSRWASEQALLLAGSSKLSDSDKLELAPLILYLGGEFDVFPFTELIQEDESERTMLTFEEFLAFCEDKDTIALGEEYSVFNYDEDLDSYVSPSDFEADFSYSCASPLFMFPSLSEGPFRSHIFRAKDWLWQMFKTSGNHSVRSYAREHLSKLWGQEVTVESESVEIGTVNGETIYRHLDVIHRN